jgi:hypothetical protein
VTAATPIPPAIAGRDSVHFHHFEQKELDELRTEWKHMTILSDAPSVVDVPSGLIPRISRSVLSNSEMVDCVYDADDRPVAAAARVRRSGTRSPAAGSVAFGHVARDERTAYFLGENARHFGHFLLETLSRGWAWKDREDAQVAMILSPPIRQFARSICSLIPGLAERMEELQSTTRFDRVIVPSPAFVISRSAHTQFKRLCEEMAERAVNAREPMTDQPVYLSRAGLDPRKKRMLVGEERLERCLASHGFRIVRPETLSIPEQITIFCRHKWIVAPLGSACHTRLFSLRPNNVLVLTRKLKANYVLCDLLCEGESHYAEILSVPDIGMNLVAGATQPVMLDEQRLLALLRDFGLIRSKAAFDSPPPDLKAYRERWIEFAKMHPAERRKGKLQRRLDEPDRSSED